MIRYSLRQTAVLIALDFVTIVVSLYLASYLRIHFDIGIEGPEVAFGTPQWLYLLVPLLWVFSLLMAQMYVLRRNLNLSQSITNLMLGQAGATLLFWGLLYVGFRDYSRLQSFYVIGISFVLLVGTRLIWRSLAAQTQRDDYQSSRVVIIGHSEMAERLTQALSLGDASLIRFVGYVDLPDETTGDAAATLGPLDDLAAIVEKHHVTDIIIAIKWFDQAAVDLIVRILQTIEASNVDVRVSPDYSDVAYFQASSDMFAGIPLIAIREPVLTHSERFIKRALDVVFASAALLLCLPLFAVIALAIRLDSPGPILLRQERIGYRGRPFRMMKFRSMFHNPGSTPAPGTPYNLQKLKDDPRITRVGRVLRRTSLDELPQFLNVLKGDMSVVGPRPEVPWMVEHYEWWQRKRFEVPQGMTGWWQINGRADKPMYYHTSDDLYYIRNYSVWLDLRIILRTIIVVVLGRGAY